MSLDNLKKTIAALEAFDIEKESMKIINENADVLVALLRDQMKRGKDSNDEPVRLFGSSIYASSTIYSKTYTPGLDEIGRETKWITNYFRGRFYIQLFVKTEGTKFFIDSSVPYFPDILLRSGRVALELNHFNISLFRDEILAPQLKERFNQIKNGF